MAMLRLAALLLWLFTSLALCAVPSAWSQRLAVPVVTTSFHPAYGEAVEGIRQTLAAQGYDTVLIDLGGRRDGELVRKRVGAATVAPVITVGTVATDVVREALPEARLVFTMVLRPKDDYFMGGGATGVVAAIPVAERLSWFKRLVPAIRRVGVMFTPRSKDALAAAQAAASGLELEVVPIEVEKPSQLPEAEELLAAKADSLLSVPDGAIYNEVLTPHIILFTIRHRIPFMGLSRSFTRSGALLSLDFDYRDAGSQAAEMAVRVMEGAAPKEIPVAVPRRVFPVVNGRIADMIGVKLTSREALREE